MDEQDATVASLLEGTPIGLQAGTGAGTQSFQGPAVAPRSPPPPAPPPGTPAGAAAAATDDNDPVMQRLLGSVDRSQALQQQQLANSQQANQMARQATSEYAAGSQGDIREALARLQPIQRYQAQDTSQTAQAWVMAMVGLAGFMGARGRNAATNALTAFGSGIQGFAKGNAELADRSLKEWQANANAASEDNALQLKKLDLILRNRATNYDQKMAEAKLLASETRDAILMEQANRGDILAIGEYRDKKAMAGVTFAEHTAKVQKTIEEIKLTREKQQALHNSNLESTLGGVVTQEHLAEMKQHLQDPNLDPYHKALLTEAVKQAEEGGVSGRTASTVAADVAEFKATGNVRLPPASRSNKNMAAANARYRTEIQNRGNAELDEEGVTPEERQQRWRVAKNMAPYLAKEGPRVGRLAIAVGHLDVLRQLGEIRRSGDMRPYEDLRGWIMEKTGKNPGTNIDLARQLVGAEIINAVASVGAGGQHERQLMAAGFAPNASQAQFNGAIDTAQKLLAPRLDQARRLAIQNGVSPQQFDNLLPARVRARLQQAEEPLPYKDGQPLKPPSTQLLEDARRSIRKGNFTREQVIERFHAAGWDTSAL